MEVLSRVIKQIRQYIEVEQPVYNPFIPGALVGALTGNLSLALLTTGLTILFWGVETGLNFIIIHTILLVELTGNINFEIVFIYSITLAYLLREQKLLKRFDLQLAFLLGSGISLALFPLWRSVLGIIPAQILNELNIAGEIMLLAGLILTVRRGFYLIRSRRGKGQQFSRFIIIFVMAALGITGNPQVLILWAAGLILINFLEDRRKTTLPFSMQYFLLLLITVLTGYNLLPLNIVLLTGLGIIGFYLVYRKERVQLLEMVYLSALLGLLAGRLGLLR